MNNYTVRWKWFYFYFRHERCLYPYDENLDSSPRGRAKVIHILPGDVNIKTLNHNNNNHSHRSPSNDNGRISRVEIINGDEQEIIIKKKKKSKKITALEQSFNSIATKKRDDGKAARASNTDVIQWCLDSGVLGRHLNSNQVDEAFCKVKPPGRKWVFSSVHIVIIYYTFLCDLDLPLV